MRLTTQNGTSPHLVGLMFCRPSRFTWSEFGDAQDMYVPALVTQKGGSGRSALAVGLAVAAMENGERVAFVEADPQGTISKWKERRGNPYPRVVRVSDPADLERTLSRLEAEGIWLAIIDTAATNNGLAM